jgi:hypothetical protein
MMYKVTGYFVNVRNLTKKFLLWEIQLKILKQYSTHNLLWAFNCFMFFWTKKIQIKCMPAFYNSSLSNVRHVRGKNETGSCTSVVTSQLRIIVTARCADTVSSSCGLFSGKQKKQWNHTHIYCTVTNIFCTHIFLYLICINCYSAANGFSLWKCTISLFKARKHFHSACPSLFFAGVFTPCSQSAHRAHTPRRVQFAFIVAPKFALLPPLSRCKPWIE